MSKKYGIVLMGGGAKGAFSLGFAKAIQEAGINISVISGTSVGAIVGACLATGKLKELEDVFRNAKNSGSFYHLWNFPKIWNVIRKKSFFNNEPIIRIAREILKEEDFQRTDIQFGCAATNIDTGELETFTNSKNQGLMIDSVLASATLPPAFPFYKIKNSNYVDGGLREAIPVELAVELDPTCDEYIIVLPTKGALEIEKVQADKLSIFEYGSRLFDILFNQIYIGNIQIGLQKYWKNSKFKFIQPDIQIVKSALDFNHERMNAAIDEGYNQGRIFLAS